MMSATNRQNTPTLAVSPGNVTAPRTLPSTAAASHRLLKSQFRHLIEMAALDNVHLRVIPYTAGLYPSAGYPFVILGFPEPVDPDVVLVENRAGERYFDNAQEVAGFHADFKHIAESSLPEEATLALLRRPLSGTIRQ
ncbi:hypothetical protein GCM10010191_57960 [Actinomadura vinacea]|uniref:DUF5753 domain-containing protein n=1 Tax=Actinomadura vinacea TaxID=115336 RepID=A0ABN3JNL6_9ACTN